MTVYHDIAIGGGDTAAPLNLDKRLELLSTFCDLAHVRLLDGGCGAGEYVFALCDRYGTDAWGVEYSAEKVAEATRHPRYGARISQGDLQHLDEPDNSFDVVLLNEVLEHVPDDEKGMHEIHRVIKPGGRVIVFSPNRLYPFETHGVTLKGIGTRLPPAVPLIPYVPVRLGRWLFHYTARNYWPHELKRLLHSAGFAVVKSSYVWQTFENISGRQPWVVGRLRPALRTVARFCEGVPLVRRLGVSQVIVGQKSESSFSVV